MKIRPLIVVMIPTSGILFRIVLDDSNSGVLCPENEDPKAGDDHHTNVIASYTLQFRVQLV